jgi:hypothetical protein
MPGVTTGRHGRNITAGTSRPEHHGRNITAGTSPPEHHRRNITAGNVLAGVARVTVPIYL